MPTAMTSDIRKMTNLLELTFQVHLTHFKTSKSWLKMRSQDDLMRKYRESFWIPYTQQDSTSKHECSHNPSLIILFPLYFYNFPFYSPPSPPLFFLFFLLFFLLVLCVFILLYFVYSCLWFQTLSSQHSI